MSVVSQFILKADDELRYPSGGELQKHQRILETGEQRMRIAATLAENEKVFNKPGKQLWQKRLTSLPWWKYGAPTGFYAYATAGARLITYGVWQATKASERLNTGGVRECTTLWETRSGMVESIHCLKRKPDSTLSQKTQPQRLL